MHELGDLYGAAEALSDQEIIDSVVAIHAAENLLAARKLAALAEFSKRGLSEMVGHTKPGPWLALATRVALGNAYRQFDTAVWLGSFPTVTAALAASDIHAGHFKAIYDGHNHIKTADPTLTAEKLADVVADLLTSATAGTPEDVKVRAQELAHAAAEDARARYEEKKREQDERRDAEPPVDDGDPIGPPPPAVSENTDLNKLDLYEQANGRTTIQGDVDKILGEKLRSAIAEHSRPEPGPDGARDPRNASKRQADGLSRILELQAGRGDASGPATRVNATVKLRDLLAPGADCTPSPSSNRRAEYPGWPFHLNWTGPISHSLARMLTCDAEFNPIIVDDNGAVLAMGQSVRLATREQRIAVTVRDRCCIKCGSVADWCQVHHIVFWRDDGNTDITNLTLLCTNCHNDIHHRGWDVVMGDDGHPFLVPPISVDPERKPIPSYHRRRKPAA